MLKSVVLVQPGIPIGVEVKTRFPLHLLQLLMRLPFIHSSEYDRHPSINSLLYGSGGASGPHTSIRQNFAALLAVLVMASIGIAMANAIIICLIFMSLSPVFL